MNHAHAAVSQGPGLFADMTERTGVDAAGAAFDGVGMRRQFT
jgi:hypothetical protein